MASNTAERLQHGWPYSLSTAVDLNLVQLRRHYSLGRAIGQRTDLKSKGAEMASANLKSWSSQTANVPAF